MSTNLTKINFLAKIVFSWASGWYNNLIKWVIREIEGWKVCEYKTYYNQQNNLTFNFHIDSEQETENSLIYFVSGDTVWQGDFNIKYFEAGIGNTLKNIFKNLLVKFLGYAISFSVVITILSWNAEQITSLGWNITLMILLVLGGIIAYNLIRGR